MELNKTQAPAQSFTRFAVFLKALPGSEGTYDWTLTPIGTLISFC